jgi:hypothetical protein
MQVETAVDHPTASRRLPVSPLPSLLFINAIFEEIAIWTQVVEIFTNAERSSFNSANLKRREIEICGC